MEKTNEDIYTDIFADTTAEPTPATQEPVVEEVPKTPEPTKDTVPPAKVETPEVKKEVKSSFPVKQDGEDDVAFNIRQQLQVAKLARDSATTEEEKSFFKEKMNELRSNLTQQSEKKPEVVLPPKVDDVEEETDDNIKARLEALGYKDAKSMSAEVAKMVSDKLNELKAEETTKAHGQVIDAFYKNRQDIYSNKEARDFLESFVIENFRVGLNTPPSQLAQYLEIAAKTYFPKENKFDKAQKAQDKVDLLNIEGGSTAQPKKRTLDDKAEGILKNAGWNDSDLDSFGFNK